MRKLILCFCILATAHLQTLGQTVTLIASNFGGYNVRCFGGNNGSVTANVTGGTPPYSYVWSNGAATASISNLRQGYYSVRVDDANTATPAVIREITLTEPASLVINLTPYLYPNQRNISCYGCSNGSITTTVTGGVTPYTFLWAPANVTVQNPNNLGVGDNTVVVTDANTCTANAGRNLSQPDKVDWTMTGNSGTNPVTQFLGTTDNKDFVFKTNNNERLRIKSNGDLNINENLNIQNYLSFQNSGYIGFQPASGSNKRIMSFGALPNNSVNSVTSCQNPVINTFQFNGTIQLWGNSAAGTHPINVLEVGYDTYNSFIDATGNVPGVQDANRLLIDYYCGHDVFICTGANGGNVQLGTDNSIVGIGCDPTTFAAGFPFKLAVNGNIIAEQVRVKAFGNWPDYVFNDENKLMPLSDLKKYIAANKHLPGIPTENEVKKDGIDVADMQAKLLQKIEEQALYIIELKEEINDIKITLANSKKHK